MSEAIRFNSVEEELAYLRSRVESYSEKPEAVKQAILETHRALPAPMRQTVEVKDTLANVASAPVDAQLDKMIQVTRTKGVFHALSVAEKLLDWKHEDDFHDHLVDLVRQGLRIRDVKESGPMYRALNMTLFEVVMPDSLKSEGGQDRDLKSTISSMEQFYAGMISVSEEATRGKNYFVLEVANSEGSEEANFFVSVPNEKKDLFEKQLRSVFPSVKLIERANDYNIFSEHGETAAAEAELDQPSALPLKTFDQFDHDPLNALLQSFSKIPKDGSGAAIQIVFNPKGDVYTKRYNRAIEQMKKGEKLKDVLAERSFVSDIFHTVGDLFVAKKKRTDEEKLKDTDQQAIERIQKKLESPVVATNIRIVTSSATKEEAKQILTSIASAFNQFELPGVNRLNWREVRGKEFYRNFTFRLWSDKEEMPLSLKELTGLLHFHTTSIVSPTQLKVSRSNESQAPTNIPMAGTLLGVNHFQGHDKRIHISYEDRLRHIYTIGQTGTGKSTLLKNIIIQDIKAGNGVCMIDPHGQDVLDVLASIPPERVEDVIYFDPASTERPLALNMLEYEADKPEQKTFVVNELFNIFQKLYGKVPESMGPMFEQYFRNATMLVIDDPSTGSTLLDVSRVLSNKEYRNMKLEKCTNSVVTQFWREVAEKAGGEAALANIVPYITSKFDVFLANDIMRPIVAQEKSSINMREIMDGRKILLVNLSKGRLGDINANLIGLILVGKILMSALSRANTQALPPFYLHIDEFQNITTSSIATILSEARKYKLSLTVAHQFIAQLEEDIKNAVFGNVGSIISFRVGADDAEYLEKQFAPVFTAQDLMNIDNRNAYVKLLVGGKPEKPFSIETEPPFEGNREMIDILSEKTKLKYGRNREEVEKEILAKYGK